LTSSLALVPPMSDDAATAAAKLNRLARELAEREKEVKKRLAYFRGEHPLKYASPEFRTYFGSQYAGFCDNWVAPVINAPTERMNLLGIRLDDDGREVDPDLERVMRANDGERGTSELFVIALATGRAFASVWGDPDDEDTPRVTFERPDQAIVEYGDRRQRVAGMWMWRDDRYEYATLDDGTNLWKFQRLAYGGDGRLRSGLVLPSTAVGGWHPREVRNEPWPVPNPMGVVSLVELSNHCLLDSDNPLSDIDGVIAMQDAINLIWAYLMNALDYASLPQRVVTGSDIPTVPVLDENGVVKGRRPVELDQLIRDRILWVPNPNAKTAEWSAAALDVFSAVIERAIEHIAAQTRTPPHYLIGKIQNVAAEALTAAETGLVSKTGERITYLSPGVKEIYRLIALAQDDEAKAAAVRSGTLIWKDIQFRGLGQLVDALVKMSQIGFPFEWIAEQYGLTPPEVERVIRMRKAEQEQDPVAAIARELGGGDGRALDSAGSPP
jgi:hypothetical protein